MSLYTLYCRSFQFVLRASSYILPWRQPTIFTTNPSMVEQMKSMSISRVLIVSDQMIVKLGLMQPLLKNLDEQGINYHIFSDTVANPTISNIEAAAKVYQDTQCDSILAFGGGSPMDCAKGVGARLVRPNKSFAQLKGLLKVRRSLPPFFAVPTTSGTGSEATIAAVVTDDKTHEKYAVNDPSLVPHYALLDPLLTLGLPPFITATTGMDALTHAIEAYIGQSNTANTKAAATEASQLIASNLFIAYEQGENIEARANMQHASYLAGVAFTRAYVGYVHAISHALGGLYSVAHGLANSVVLPHVLRQYGEVVYPKLAELSLACGIALPQDNMSEQALKFIRWIEQSNTNMGIPTHIVELQESDIAVIVERALKEANPLYPVPRIFNRDEMTLVVTKLLAE
ncbi:MAG: iron-containing alcohol dehydrogenase [Oleispira antarctica]|nr:iron-containing alcohol dehydrogenase [Oleispira antarctica]MBQ0791657.1 iron-containing alcohol dehydrogenase [Oleispira antarctica]